jgi:DNA polymerase III epsilon subunit-like protein
MAAPKEKSQIITAFVMDFETGGLDCKKCAATQISVHAIRLDTFEVMDTFTKYIYPYQSRPDIGKPKKKVLRSKYEDEEEELQTLEYGKVALEYSAITMDMLYNQGEDLEAVCNELVDFFKKYTLTTSKKLKPIFVGQNILFDLGFLQQIMSYCGLWKEIAKIFRGNEDFFGNFQPYYVDTIIFSQLAFCHKDGINSWSLSNLCELLGIELDDAHDADADVTATKEVLRLLTVRSRNEDVEDGDGSTVVTKKEKTREHFKI